MYQNRNKPVLSDLHQRLYSILPEYEPISLWNATKSGTFKAVDYEGNVYLVDFEPTEDGFRRCKRFFCDYAALMATSTLKTEPKRCKPEENWVLTLLG